MFATHTLPEKVEYFIKAVCGTRRRAILPSLCREQERLSREEKQGFPSPVIDLNAERLFAFLFAVTQRATAAESDSEDGVRR